jgi:hypothetical protein
MTITGLRSFEAEENGIQKIIYAINRELLLCDYLYQNNNLQIPQAFLDILNNRIEYLEDLVVRNHDISHEYALPEKTEHIKKSIKSKRAVPKTSLIKRLQWHPSQELIRRMKTDPLGIPSQGYFDIESAIPGADRIRLLFSTYGPDVADSSYMSGVPENSCTSVLTIIDDKLNPDGEKTSDLHILMKGEYVQRVIGGTEGNFLNVPRHATITYIEEVIGLDRSDLYQMIEASENLGLNYLKGTAGALRRWLAPDKHTDIPILSFFVNSIGKIPKKIHDKYVSRLQRMPYVSLKVA